MEDFLGEAEPLLFVTELGRPTALAKNLFVTELGVLGRERKTLFFGMVFTTYDTVLFSAPGDFDCCRPRPRRDNGRNKRCSSLADWWAFGNERSIASDVPMRAVRAPNSRGILPPRATFRGEL